MTELPCPTCGSELSYLEQYQRFYCHRCQRYAPDGYGAKGARKCTTCGGVLSYVTQYGRFYCYRCNAYAPAEPEAPAGETPKAVDVTPAPEPAPAATPVPAPAPVVVAEPAPATPSPAPTPEPPTAAQPAAGPAEPSPWPRMEEPAPIPAASPTVAETPKPEEAPKEERPPRPDVKPAVLRLKIFTMRKSELMDLCKAYDLDPGGTKEQLQERLLSYLKDLEAESEGEERTPDQPAAAREPPEAHAEPTPAPAVAVVEEAVAQAEPEPTPPMAAIPLVVTQEAPAAVAHAVAPVVITPESVPASSHVEHPCPTCGRELSFVSQYGRWYCYGCQRYAPATKNACPTCGTTMRFIDQYERWWCDSCRRYGPADLPKPRTAAAAPAAQTASAALIEARPVVAHRHGSPGSGIALLAFGLMLYVAYAALTLFPAVLNYTPPPVLSPPDLALLSFLAFLFMAIGALVGLASLRHLE